MIRIDGGPAPGLTDLHTATAQHQGTRERTGTLAGEQVRVKDASSMLADGAEEISLHHSDKVESKKISERKLESQGLRELMKIDEIRQYLDAAGQGGDPKRLAELAKRMQSGEQNPRELARQQSREPADQYVLLQHALQDAIENKLAPEVIERLEDALADLELEAGPQIRAGLNSLGTLSELARNPGELEALRSTYRDVVLGDGSLAQTLKLALERLGGTTGAEFQRGLQGLVKALGADLSSARPSTEPNRLQALVQDLYQLEVCATVLDACHELSAKLQEKHGAAPLPAVELMKELVAVTGERWVGGSRFTDLAGRFNLHDTGAQIAFLTSTKAMMRDLPVKVFPDPESRQTVLDATQSALDDAIEKEEE
jgi:type III secretion protein W